jgi:dienelactone hydrolase
MVQKSARVPARREVQFRSGDSYCSAWLYLPVRVAGEQVPMVVMGHGLGATRELRLDTYAERFVAAGMAVLAFTYRNLGDSGSGPRQVLSMPKQLSDWDAALEYATSLPEVDENRIAVWGTSLGGGHAFSVAARHPELRAAVSQCPFTDGVKTASALRLRDSLAIFPFVARDLLAAVRGKDPVCIPVAAAPGEVAFMQAPDALPGCLAMVPEGHQWVNQAAARSLLSIISYRPGRAARKIVPPILVCISKEDSVAPAAVAEHYARQAPRADIRHYDAGHFDFYVGEAFEQLVADQLEFLVKHLEPASKASRRTEPSPTTV